MVSFIFQSVLPAKLLTQTNSKYFFLSVSAKNSDGFMPMVLTQATAQISCRLFSHLPLCRRRSFHSSATLLKWASGVEPSNLTTPELTSQVCPFSSRTPFRPQEPFFPILPRTRRRCPPKTETQPFRQCAVLQISFKPTKLPTLFQGLLENRSYFVQG